MDNPSIIKVYLIKWTVHVFNNMNIFILLFTELSWINSFCHILKWNNIIYLQICISSIVQHFWSHCVHFLHFTVAFKLCISARMQFGGSPIGTTGPRCGFWTRFIFHFYLSCSVCNSKTLKNDRECHFKDFLKNLSPYSNLSWIFSVQLFHFRNV